MNKLEFNMLETQCFLDVLEVDGNFTFLTFDDQKSGRTSLLRQFHGSLYEHAEDLQILNQQGAGVFVTINATDGNGRKAENITRVRAHFIDSDDKPIEDVLKTFPLPPTMTVESSDGKGHAYFKVDDTPLAEFKTIQQGLNGYLGTDPAVCDLPRTMRLPGFYHMKGEPRLVKISNISGNQKPYSKDEILAALPMETSSKYSSVDQMARYKADPTAMLGDGQRTAALVYQVGYLIAKGLDDTEIFNMISNWNIAKCTPPLPEGKLLSTIQSIRSTDNRNHPTRYGVELTNTDTGNAKRFALKYGENLRYCNDRAEWLEWDEKRWVFRESNDLIGMAQQTAFSITDDAAKASSTTERDLVWKWAKTSLSAASLRNMISLAQCESVISTNSSWLDKNDWLLNVNNGTLDLKEHKFREHNRSDMITKHTPVNYDPSASCPKWMNFLETIFNGDYELISWLQKVFGYSLTGSTDEQCIFMLIGDGCNGKSTLLKTMHMVMCDYAVQANSDTFMAQKYSQAGSARSDLVKLTGKRIVFASEAEEGQRLAESFIKQITGGEEISTRGLYQKTQIEYKPKFKVFYCSNHKPIIKGTDNGIWRRIMLIPFSVRIAEADRNPHLLEEFCQEASGILKWAYEGCIRWQSEGLADIPKVVREASDQYKAENDVIGKFLGDCCYQDGEVQSSKLYGAFSDWCRENGCDQKGQNEFICYLERNGCIRKKTKKGIFWNGLSLIGHGCEVSEAA